MFEDFGRDDEDGDRDRVPWMSVSGSEDSSSSKD